MACAGIQMLMDKLKQLINCNDIPFINNNPTIIAQRPQFQLLYDDLRSMTQSLEHQDLHDLGKVIDLKKRFTDAAEEADYIVDLFLSGVHLRNYGYLCTSGGFNPSVNLDGVRRSFRSIEEEFISMRVHNMKMDSSQTIPNQSQSSISANSQGSKNLFDEIVVGLDRDAQLVIEKLVANYPKKLDVVSIVGMGGIGKTTLATKVFNDGYVKHHFYVRVWVTVSQTNDERDVLFQILESMGVNLNSVSNLEKATGSQLREMVYKHLMHKRYLIVVDDIWSIETWDNLKYFLPDYNRGSRILLTTRHIEVAKQAKSDGLIHHLGFLNKENSWELLCKKVFHGNGYPEWSIKPGMQIVENCHGLPLTVVVIARVLAKKAWSKMFWLEIAHGAGSYIVEGNGCLETLAISYNHLPLHMRQCFLYLGGFPENHNFQVQRLISLWVAEGLIQEDGNRRLEDIAKGYLMDLIDRNLVIVADRWKSNGAVKACILHDLVKKLCMRKAKEECFILKSERLILSSQIDEIVVGLDRDVELIRDKLVEDQKKVDVVSLVGMGGIGKTTLATQVFNDGYIKQHFHVRVWVTVSQTYDKRAVLFQILASIGIRKGLEKASDSRLHELVYKKLTSQRYLIVVDDIWHIETWDNMKLFFPHDNNGSRILLTTRLTEVARHANSVGLIHHLRYLNKEMSWELLCHKLFHGNKCPKWSTELGMKIIQNCKGLPLAVLFIAGVLAKEAWSEKLWVEISERMDSYIVGGENGCMEIFDLCYSDLPDHLRLCLRYFSLFPEDYKISVKELTLLWIAEGFIEEDGKRRLEDIAEGYLMDLIDRNLVIVADRSKSNGGVKACKMHDVVLELLLSKIKQQLSIHQTNLLRSSSNVITPPYKPVRMFINTYNPDLSHLSNQSLRSILWFSDVSFLSDDIAKYIRSFALLRVLDLQKCMLKDFPKGVELLIHLRYLAIWILSEDFPSSICNLWNLQTLIYNTSGTSVFLPINISDLVNLRHLWGCMPFGFGSIVKPMNLQTVSHVRLKDEAHSFQKYFPCIKKLKCTAESNMQIGFISLTYLERLSLWSSPVHCKNHLTFPVTLKTLTLERCGLPWRDMSIVQSLPNLQVLKLHHNAFEGSCWNTDEKVFPQLKFLRLRWLDIKLWEVNSTSFPCLRHLEIIECRNLEEAPFEIGDIPTLNLIKIGKCSHSVDESIRRIQEEQQDLGNYDLKIDVTPFEDIDL